MLTTNDTPQFNINAAISVFLAAVVDAVVIQANARIDKVLASKLEGKFDSQDEAIAYVSSMADEAKRQVQVLRCECPAIAKNVVGREIDLALEEFLHSSPLEEVIDERCDSSIDDIDLEDTVAKVLQHGTVALSFTA